MRQISPSAFADVRPMRSRTLRVYSYTGCTAWNAGTGAGLYTAFDDLVIVALWRGARPAPARRQITFLRPDGRPKENFDLSIYLWDQNHSGVHEGAPRRRLR